jgi:hypothetical protein
MNSQQQCDRSALFLPMTDPPEDNEGRGDPKEGGSRPEGTVVNCEDIKELIVSERQIHLRASGHERCGTTEPTLQPPA